MMPAIFDPIRGVEGWQLSTPPILSLSVLLASLEIFAAVGMQQLRQKSILLTGYLEFLINKLLQEEITIITPQNQDERGCQLSLVLKEKQKGKRLHKDILEAGILCDWREPDVIRCAPVPLYNRFIDVYNFVKILEKSILHLKQS